MMAEDGMAPVHAAAQAGQVSCLQWLVEQSGVPIRFNAEDGATPAHFAAASGEVRGYEDVRERKRALKYKYFLDVYQFKVHRTSIL